MEEQIKISVIIPVYKVEQYIHRSIMSVINQDYTNWEIILVDDGSPDNCPQICDEYAAKYSNISVVHQSNKGLSDARNTGMLHVKGDLLVFLDSDDSLAEDAFSTIVNYFPTDADLLFLDYNECYTDSSIRKKLFDQDTIDFSDDKRYTKTLLERAINEIHKETETNATVGYVWSVVYKISFLQNNNIFFPSETQLLEDKAFLLKCICHTNNIYYRSFELYNYFINEGSLSNTSYAGKADYVLSVFKKLYSYVKDIKSDDKLFQRQIEGHYGYAIIITFLWRSVHTEDSYLKEKGYSYCTEIALHIWELGVRDFPVDKSFFLFLVRHHFVFGLESIVKMRRILYDISSK